MGIRRDIFFRQIGAKIAYYRILYGMEQNQLAEKVHISQSTLSRIERGKYGDNISISLLLDIAEHLHQSLFRIVLLTLVFGHFMIVRV